MNNPLREAYDALEEVLAIAERSDAHPELQIAAVVRRVLAESADDAGANRAMRNAVVRCRGCSADSDMHRAIEENAGWYFSAETGWLCPTCAPPRPAPESSAARSDEEIEADFQKARKEAFERYTEDLMYAADVPGSTPEDMDEARVVHDVSHDGPRDHREVAEYPFCGRRDIHPPHTWRWAWPDLTPKTAECPGVGVLSTDSAGATVYDLHKRIEEAARLATYNFRTQSGKSALSAWEKGERLRFAKLVAEQFAGLASS